MGEADCAAAMNYGSMPKSNTAGDTDNEAGTT
jgi:hypothetical protein